MGHNQSALQILNVLESILGKAKTLTQGEYAFRCPFCQHHKRKLQIHIDRGVYHCWVCDNKGRSLFSLFKKLHASKHQFDTLSELLGTVRFDKEETEEEKAILYLPPEFKSLVHFSRDPAYGNALRYLKKRGLTRGDILKHNIGFCSEGLYGGMVVVPSYDSDGNLNFFVGRSIYESSYKFKNPPISRNVVGFDLHINWNEPIVLVEGVFDAIAVKRNAVPLFGKYMSQSLLSKIVNNKVRLVIMAMDADAKDSVIKIAENLIKKDVEVGYVRMSANEDPSELGFVEMNKRLHNITELNFSTLTRLKVEQRTIWKRRE